MNLTLVNFWAVLNFIIGVVNLASANAAVNVIGFINFACVGLMLSIKDNK